MERLGQAIVRRLKGSVECRAMRVKSAAKQWFHTQTLKPIAWNQAAGRPLAFMVGARHVPMLALALESLRRHEQVIPPLILAADSPEAAVSLERLVGRDSRHVTVAMWDAGFARIPNEWRGFLERYVAHPQWAGFGKKLSFLLALNTDADVTYSDCDMLWYAAMLPDVNVRLCHSPSGMCLGADSKESYDSGLLGFLGFEFVSPLALNTGFMAIRQRVLIEALLDERMADWHSFPGPFGCHTEQTLIACAADCIRAEVFPTDFVGISMSDYGRLTRQFTPRVRHYAGPKTLFWRDC